MRSPALTTATVEEDDDDDDDVRSLITNITTATIAPSESASQIFRNKFDDLQASSSSETESTPRSRSMLTHVDETTSAESEVDDSVVTATSTAKPCQSSILETTTVSYDIASPRRKSSERESAS